MRFAFGVLHMRADDFWGMTLMEWFAAVDGYRALHTPKEKKVPATKENLRDLFRTHNARFKK